MWTPLSNNLLCHQSSSSLIFLVRILLCIGRQFAIKIEGTLGRSLADLMILLNLEAVPSSWFTSFGLYKIATRWSTGWFGVTRGADLQLSPQPAEPCAPLSLCSSLQRTGSSTIVFYRTRSHRSQSKWKLIDSCRKIHVIKRPIKVWN
uniref:Uncharacterized protein n=1 Tax=Physcomitrium patens TaxID=3218 RepID=A0A2K1KAU6_PHYPA|nr:hypothetical protein PHYPA_010087 [Physcomitrium patens]